MSATEFNELVYQTENGAIALREDTAAETIWASLDELAFIFDKNKSTISRHIKNIFSQHELDETSVVAKNATTASDGKTYQVTHYNLDMIISVGYRVNSKKATHFRQWATQTLKQHITQGYTLNETVLKQREAECLKLIDELKTLTSRGELVTSQDTLEIIKLFSSTWFSLQKFDDGNTPTEGYTTKELDVTVAELYEDIAKLKADLIQKGEASELFAQEKKPDSLAGIFGNVMQSVFGEEAYPTLEEKAAHLLYFIVKNHPFNDGNKRTGAFAFVWFLERTGMDFKTKITPEALTALTLLVAQSQPEDKARIIGLILLMFQT